MGVLREAVQPKRLLKVAVIVVVVLAAAGGLSLLTRHHPDRTHQYYCQEAHKVGDYGDPTCAKYP